MRRYGFLLMSALMVGCTTSNVPDDVPVVDTHVHFYDMNRPEGIPWPRATDKVLYKPTLPEEFNAIARANNVQKVVVVQAGGWLMDNQWNLDVTSKHTDLYVGVVGSLGIIGTKEFKPTLTRLAKDPRFVGIRISKRHETRPLFSGTIWEDLKLMSEKNLTLDVLMNNHEVHYGFVEVDKIAARNPELRIVMNHVAGYPIDGKSIDPAWAKSLKAMARHKNVYCKVSALIERSVVRPHSFDDATYKDILDFLYETFGEDRLIYGSDWPVTKYSGGYDQHKQVVTRYFSQKGDVILKKVMHDNALNAYDLE